jgi:hypothetical protein
LLVAVAVPDVYQVILACGDDNREIGVEDDRRNIFRMPTLLVKSIQTNPSLVVPNLYYSQVIP